MLNMGLNLFEVKKMRVFLSWSGDCSHVVAQELKKWIPCLIDVDVFFSAEDIEKGENWPSSIVKELSSCSYGIVCLTKDNKDKPWINFEAGAISKALDSHLSALLIDIVPSDIQGPMKLYQATKFEKDDFFALIKSINNVLGDAKKSEELLQTRFNAMWEEIRTSIEKSIEATGKKEKKTDRSDKKEQSESKATEATEEILQLLRQQSAILNDPERFFAHFERVSRDGNDFDTLRKILLETEKTIIFYSHRATEANYIERLLGQSIKVELMSLEECSAILRFIINQLTKRFNFDLEANERREILTKANQLQFRCVEILEKQQDSSNKNE